MVPCQMLAVSRVCQACLYFFRFFARPSSWPLLGGGFASFRRNFGPWGERDLAQYSGLWVETDVVTEQPLFLGSLSKLALFSSFVGVGPGWGPCHTLASGI